MTTTVNLHVTVRTSGRGASQVRHLRCPAGSMVLASGQGVTVSSAEVRSLRTEATLSLSLPRR